MFFEHISPFYLEAIGVVGFISYVATYTMLTMRILSGDSIYYFCLNLGSSSMVMIGLMGSFNLASALVQGFWITMSLIGISMRIWRSSAPRPAAGV